MADVQTGNNAADDPSGHAVKLLNLRAKGLGLVSGDDRQQTP